ncbi:MAG: hypothetical protein AMXMBFR36_35950 [Acidobacteriota bacterium]
MKADQKALMLTMTAALALGLVSGNVYLNRRIEASDPVAGEVTTYFSWGRVAKIDSGRNRDGRVDAEVVFRPTVAWERAASVSPSESWLDQDLDGAFEIGVKKSRGGELLSLGVDTDGDGTFDRVIAGEDAAVEMKRVRARNAVIIEKYGTWRKEG